jgi:hypothetical protein
MVQAGGRRLNPLQPATANDCLPIDGHFCMATKDVCFGELASDPFLTSVDDFGTGRNCLNLSDVFRFDGIAEHNSHGFGSARVNQGMTAS